MINSFGLVNDSEAQPVKKVNAKKNDWNVGTKMSECPAMRKERSSLGTNEMNIYLRYSRHLALGHDGFKLPPSSMDLYGD